MVQLKKGEQSLSRRSSLQSQSRLQYLKEAMKRVASPSHDSNKVLFT